MQDTYTISLIAARVQPAQLVALGADVPLEHYQFDTRQLHSPDTTIFLALQGEHRDGHDFVQAAYEKGVRNFWLQQRMDLPGANQLVVPNVLAALQQLAAAHRTQFPYPVIGITGSNGKTIIKEWLSSLLQGSQRLVKSPRSFNSQLGVALSLLEMRSHHTLAIIEAGISQAGEMARLAKMIRPSHGILTHFGDAHAEGFSNETEKLFEKLTLFESCEYVFCTADDPKILQAFSAKKIPVVTVGTSPGADVRAHHVVYKEGAWRWQFELKSRPGVFTNGSFAHAGHAALENIWLTLVAAHPFWSPAVTNDDIRAMVDALQPVSMRTEMITDNPEITILNDAYNADASSVLNAFGLLQAQRTQPRRKLILTDLEHQGDDAARLQRRLLLEAVQTFGAENICAIGPTFKSFEKEFAGVHFYGSTQQLINNFRYEEFRSSTVLLKGARSYQLEALIPYLSRHPGATYFKINLNSLKHNLDVTRRALPAGTRIMVMLKAAAYGAGSWQIAQELEREGVHYLAVAVASEGIELRQRGILLPIAVLSPDAATLGQLISHNLEPALWSMSLLRQYLSLAAHGGGPVPPVHLEFDTGMARLGFSEFEVADVLHALAAHPQVKVASVFTHLAASEDPVADEFTREQLRRFEPCWQAVRQHYPHAWVHALNTGGILRFGNDASYKALLPTAPNMVRLGIGLYGVSPVPQLQGLLQEIGSLHTAIAQIHHYPAGTSVGYNRAEILQRPSRIATLPVGYADGLPRTLGNRRLHVLVGGQRVPVVGRICMDLLMIDVTDVTANEGDEVVIFGRQAEAFQSVQQLAQVVGTIPYEILAGISHRVRRVYVKE
jgi:alanine racemase